MVMKVEYTEEEFTEFTRLVHGMESLDQVARISSRLNMSAFIKEHGKEKFDAMFADLNE